MARITGPSDLYIPSVLVNDVPLMLPADLPEGGTLQVVTGESPLAPYSKVLPLPPGCMVAMIAPEVVHLMFPNLKREPNGPPALELGGIDLYGIPLGGILWIPAGGFLNIVIGPNAAAMPVPSTPLMPDCMLAIVGPETAEKFRRGIASMGEKQNPFAVVPGVNGASL